MIDVFLIKLEDFDSFCNNSEKGFSKYKKDEKIYLISNGANFETLKVLADNDKYKNKIKHLRMQQTSEKFTTIKKAMK